MKSKYLIGGTLVLFIMMIFGIMMTAYAEDVPRISKEQLKEKLDDPNVVTIDVRSGKDWKASDVKIKGAVRRVPSEVEKWTVGLDKEKTYVLYCA